MATAKLYLNGVKFLNGGAVDGPFAFRHGLRLRRRHADELGLTGVC